MPPEFTSHDDDLPLWKAWADAGHFGCGGWSCEADVLTCDCGAGIPLAAEVSP
jgi:hypothetical protein